MGQIEDNENYNFKTKYDEDKEVFTENSHSCEYFEIDELRSKFSKHSECFSTYSHNIRSINGHWEDILDIIDSVQPMKFSVIDFQEIWSVQKIYELPGYNKF